jgi:subfamily B ATP-binding cassette protein MsbA
LGNISFDRVSFQYDTGDVVLKDITFSVSPGEVLAIVGPSGAGKSTVLDLIPRFYEPTQGHIRIGSQDLRDLTLESLRERMGIVTQEIILFNDTVARNIAYGAETVDSGAIQQAAEMANAHEFIQALPDGYDSLVGQRGVLLSGGQRQRLAIARALMKDPDILIFDEATSALDSEAELQVQEAIDRLMTHRTVFVVAHRLSTIQRADRIIVLDQGRLVEEGNHSMLYHADGLYRYLYDLQFKSAPGRAQEVKL